MIRSPRVSSLFLLSLLATLLLSCTLYAMSAHTNNPPPRRTLPASQSAVSTRGSSGWTEAGLLSAEQQQRDSMSFTLLLKQRNQAEMEKRALEVSDPKSPSYGKFMTPEEIAALVHPSLADQQTVLAWLQQAFQLGPASEHIVNKGDSIQVLNVPVQAVESAFQCRMHVFIEKPPPAPASHAVLPAADAEEQQPFTPRRILRCTDDLSVPAQVADVLDGTLGLRDFPTRFTTGPHPHPIRGPNDPRIGPRVGPVHSHTAAAPLDSAASQAQDVRSSPAFKDELSKGASSDVLKEEVSGGGGGGAADANAREVPASALKSSEWQPHAHPQGMPFKPHQTFRTPEQLQHVVQEFERARATQ